MIEKEIAEIRRRYKSEKNNISHIHGCYVNENSEIISTFKKETLIMSAEEADAFYGLFRRSLSGGLNKNLLDIEFETKQVVDSDEHRLLMALRASKLEDEGLLNAFYQQVMSCVNFEGNYLILMCHENYDVPKKSSSLDGDEAWNNESFSYFLCTICPVKLGKASLNYNFAKGDFFTHSGDFTVSSPQLGFMFPSFDNRATNIYNSLFYTRDIKEGYPEFIENIFKTVPSMPAQVQKETFNSIMCESLVEECDFGLTQAFHEELVGLIEEHKENKVEEPLLLGKKEMVSVLNSCGATEKSLATFSQNFDVEFGEKAMLSPKNIVNNKEFHLKTPDVIIKVNPLRSDLVETKVINGIKYIMICANDGVEVNGVNIDIK